MVFAKNSDRPIGEVQLAVPFGRRASAGGTLRTQYLSIGDTGAHAALLSCPTWLWGAEHGVNEFGVAIGNEDAVGIMTELLTTHGQGGIADAAHQEAYDSSFLIADPRQAYVLDTSGTSFAAGPFPDGTAISNRITLGADWTSGSADLRSGETFDRFRDPTQRTAQADVRLAASRAFLAGLPSGGLTAAAMAAHLRDHGQGPWGAPGRSGPASPPPAGSGADVSGASVCMHAPGRTATAASLIAVLPTQLGDGAPARAYVALGSPCVSIFVPAFPPTVAGPPPFVPRELSDEAMWRAAEALRLHVESDPEAIGVLREILGPIEDELWAEADDVVERPALWSEVGRTWGPRALGALAHAIS